MQLQLAAVGLGQLGERLLVAALGAGQPGADRQFVAHISHLTAHDTAGARKFIGQSMHRLPGLNVSKDKSARIDQETR